jgi:hypothetical protein
MWGSGSLVLARSAWLDLYLCLLRFAFSRECFAASIRRLSDASHRRNGSHGGLCYACQWSSGFFYLSCFTYGFCFRFFCMLLFLSFQARSSLSFVVFGGFRVLRCSSQVVMMFFSCFPVLCSSGSGPRGCYGWRP